jgi:ligand-binding SRPBCC domain-containing protein
VSSSYQRMITLDETTVIAAPIALCFDLARSVEVHLAGNTHYGELAFAIEGSTSGLLNLGDTVTWRARHFFIRQRLTSRITAFDPPAYFQDTMLRGAFRSMQHDHYFRTLPDGRTEMRDIFRFAAPIPLLGRIAEALVLRRYMQTLLRERNAVIQQIAESPTNAWQQYLV